MSGYQLIEMIIIKKTVAHFINQGNLIDVCDGEEITLVKSNDLKIVLDAMRTTDEDYLIIRTANGDKIGHIYFIYGCGPDVISDYSVSLEEHISPIYEWINKLGSDWDHLS